MKVIGSQFCVFCIDLIQPESKLVQPGQSLSIICRVSGYSVTAAYGTGWIRQSEGKSFEYIFHMWGTNGDLHKNNALKNKFSFSRDTSAGTVTITGQNLQPEDTAFYYCVRYIHSDTNHRQTCTNTQLELNVHDNVP
uniref:Ig-like domain-containing protein n=1 Tax=Kryptolebias marmoratus TaxID=37003 RepID=A0A3Q3EJU3_KRYMA